MTHAMIEFCVLTNQFLYTVVAIHPLFPQNVDQSSIATLATRFEQFKHIAGYQASGSGAKGAKCHHAYSHLPIVP